MEDKDFKRLYKRLIEYHGLSPPKAREVLRNILRILHNDKETKK